MFQRLLPAFILLALIGCEPQTPEDRLETAGDALEQSEESLEDIERRIEQHEDSLASLKKRRRQLRTRVLTLEERVAKRATDVALFRTVQSELLESEELSESAISVAAEDGIVRLSGIVDSEAKEAAATEIASAVAGVKRVESRIVVEAPETPDD